MLFWQPNDLAYPCRQTNIIPTIIGSEKSILESRQEIYLSGLKGTPAWMAPEVLGRQSVSPATDVYGLGLIFWEMLTAEKPFEGKTVMEVSS